MWWKRLLKCVLCGIFLWFPATQAEASNPQGSREWVRQQAKQIHKQGRYPKDLPQNLVKEPEKDWLTKLLERLFGPRKKRSSMDQGLSGAFRAAGPILNLLFWALIALSVALLMWVIYRFLQDSFADAKDQAALQPEIIEFFGIELPLDKSAEELRKEGRLDLALCILLLHAMREVGWKDDRQGKSKTAREAIAAVRSSDPRYSPIHRLLHNVEDVRFGGLEATQEMYLQGQDDLRMVQQTTRHTPTR
ncbi:MAG: hypothetical protein H6728_03465 [Myxococcales bacterium]|nr:hypothetical protein [Myxococcales bacterium]MCB9642109.1 hypothetical protein [Myxococcales bacterium]